jgi:hypothetical protein
MGTTANWRSWFPAMWGRLITCAAVGYRRRSAGNAAEGRFTIGRSLPSCPTRSLPACDRIGAREHLRRLLPVAVLLALGIAGLYAQDLDCNQPADVQFSPASPRANVRFQGTAGETVYIRLLFTNIAPGFSLRFRWWPIRSAISTIRGHKIRL